MKKDLLRQWTTVGFFVLVLIFNYLANALPLGGKTTGEISNQFSVYFVPAGYVFSIWGLIYLWLLAFVIYQVLPAQRQNPLLQRVGYLFVLSCLFNITWLFAWHYEVYWLTLLLMLGLLSSLIALYLQAHSTPTPPGAADRWLVQFPFRIYLGWVTVATVANVTVVLTYYRWSGWGLSPQTWMIIMLLATVAIGAAVTFTRRDPLYLLVLLWALVGIAVKHAQVTLIATTTWIMVALTALLLLFALWPQRQTSPQPTSPNS